MSLASLLLSKRPDKESPHISFSNFFYTNKAKFERKDAISGIGNVSFIASKAYVIITLEIKSFYVVLIKFV